LRGLEIVTKERLRMADEMPQVNRLFVGLFCRGDGTAVEDRGITPLND